MALRSRDQRKPRARYAGPYRRGTWGARFWCKLTEAQATEVGRYRSGVVETARKRGPKFRAPYSGYGPPAVGGLIPFKRVPHLRNLAVAGAERQGHVRTGSGTGKNWRRAS